MPTASPITQQLFASGLQCAKRLYLDHNQPDRIPELPPHRRELADTGKKLVSLAREAFPKGIAIDERGEDAFRRTEEVLGGSGAVVMFDAAFRNGEAEVRVDIALRDASEEMDIFEVKSGTRVKPRHLLDLALQVLTIENGGLKVRSVVVLHPDPQYRHRGGSQYSVHELFKHVDVTKRVRRQIGRASDMIPSFGALLRDESTLELPMGTWCTSPFRCPYFSRCAEHAPEHPLMELPDITREQEYSLHEQAIEDITQIDPDHPGLTLRQRRALRSINSDELVIEPFVPEELDELEYPVHFVSIQYLVEVLPRFEGSRPWQAIPYHFSDHVLSADGGVDSRQFLATDRSDPRPEFVRRLYEQLQDAGTVVFYTPHHESRLRTMLDDAPEVKSRLRAILNLPIVELGRLVGAGVYHPGFRGGFDLHSVAESLLPNQAGDGIDASAARDATLAYRQLIRPRTRSTTRDKLSHQISALGALESEAIMKIFLRLRQR